jgi:hypothetical protein
MYFTKLGFRFLVTSLLLVAILPIHTNKKIMDTNNITPKMENRTIIFCASLRDRRFENY